MREGLAQILEHLPLLTLVGGIMLAALGLARQVSAAMLRQYRGYLNDKFDAIEKLRSQGVAHWEDQFRDLRSLIERYDANHDSLEFKLQKLREHMDQEFISRDQCIRAEMGLDHKITTLARRMEDCQQLQCRLFHEQPTDH